MSTPPQPFLGNFMQWSNFRVGETVKSLRTHANPELLVVEFNTSIVAESQCRGYLKASAEKTTHQIIAVKHHEGTLACCLATISDVLPEPKEFANRGWWGMPNMRRYATFQTPFLANFFAMHRFSKSRWSCSSMPAGCSEGRRVPVFVKVWGVLLGGSSQLVSG